MGNPIITLPTPAPEGGVYVTLESSDPSIVTIAPTSVFIPEGATAPASQPTIFALGIGSATINAFALGHISASRTVTVPAPTMKFLPATVALTPGETGSLTLTLSGGKAPSTGLQVKLISSEPSRVALPPNVAFPAGSAAVKVPISGAAQSSATITATLAGVASATASVSVAAPPKVSATYGANSEQLINIVLSNSSKTPAVNLRVTSVTNIVIDSPNKIVLRPGMLPLLYGTLEAGAPSPFKYVIFDVAAGSIAVPFRFTITYEADNMPPQTAVISVPFPRSMNFAGSPLALKAGESGALMLTLLGNQAPATGLAAKLTSSDSKIASVPASVSFPPGGTSVPVAVTGISGGGVTVTAQATVVNFPATATAAVNVAAAPTISLADTVAKLGESAGLLVQLPTAAPTGGVTISLISSDATKVAVTPAAVQIPAGARVPAAQPQVSGAGIGSATITAAAPGYQSGIAKVSVPPPTMAFSFPTPTITAGESLSLRLSLTGGRAPAGGIKVTLKSSDGAKVKVTDSIAFSAGVTEATVAVAGVAPGSSVITAESPGFSNASTTITVTPPRRIGLPPAFTVALGRRLGPYAVSLTSPAPAGGVSVSLSSDDPTKVTVEPSVVPIPEGRTEPEIKTAVFGVGIGSATITASAPLYTPAKGLVGVSAPQMSFQGNQLMLSPGGRGNLVLTLTNGAAPPAGLTVSLSSDSRAVSVPASIAFPPGATSFAVVVTAVGVGNGMITASAMGIISAMAVVKVEGQPNVLASQSPNGSMTNIIMSNIGDATATNLRITDSSIAANPPNILVLSRSPQGFGDVAPGQAGVISLSVAARTGSTEVPFIVTIAYQADNMPTRTATLKVPFPRSMWFGPHVLKVAAATSAELTLSLTTPQRVAVTVSLASSDPSIATVAPSVSIPAGRSSVSVGVRAVRAGLASIAASAPGLGSATSTVIVATETQV